MPSLHPQKTINFSLAISLRQKIKIEFTNKGKKQYQKDIKRFYCKFAKPHTPGFYTIFYYLTIEYTIYRSMGNKTSVGQNL